MKIPVIEIMAAIYHMPFTLSRLSVICARRHFKVMVLLSVYMVEMQTDRAVDCSITEKVTARNLAFYSLRHMHGKKLFLYRGTATIHPHSH